MRRILLPAAAVLALAVTVCSVAPQIGGFLTSPKAVPAQAPFTSSVEGRSAASAPAPPSADASTDNAATRPAAPNQSTGSVAAVTVSPIGHMIIGAVTLALRLDDVSHAFQQVELIADSVGGSFTSSRFKQEGDRTKRPSLEFRPISIHTTQLWSSFASWPYG